MNAIKHIESNIKIHFTRDYSIFNSITGNRLLNGGKINRIIKDISNGLDMLKYCPIIVDQEMNVIDGQHRLHVARKLKSNIWYVISDTLTLPEIAKMNSNTERWKGKDFLQCYATQKNINYIALQEYIDKYKFPISLSMSLLTGTHKNDTGGNGKTLKQQFESGLFTIKIQQEANDIAELVYKFSSFDHFLDRGFIIAISKLFEDKKCDFDHLLKKLKEAPEVLQKQGSAKQYLKSLEELYNYKLRKREIIFA